MGTPKRRSKHMFVNSRVRKRDFLKVYLVQLMDHYSGWILIRKLKVFILLYLELENPE